MENLDSILLSVKKQIGGDVFSDAFDDDLILCINSVFSILTQLGVGPATGFIIKGSKETWTDYIGERLDIEAVKSYVYLKTRLLFDPPSNSFLVDNIKKLCDEFEWRLNVAIETPAAQSV